VACGGLHSAVSTAGQLVFAFGFNRYGQCGQGNCSNKLSTPRPVNVNIIGTPVKTLWLSVGPRGVVCICWDTAIASRLMCLSLSVYVYRLGAHLAGGVRAAPHGLPDGPGQHLLLGRHELRKAGTPGPQESRHNTHRGQTLSHPFDQAAGGRKAGQKCGQGQGSIA
jgi:hypothetical protein